MKYILFIIIAGVACCASQALAQKKLVPASGSAVAGIYLPAETLQDKRLLSTAAAAVLLEEESKKSGVSINTAEVFQLPPKTKSGYGLAEFQTALRQAGWQITPVESDPSYAWLRKGERYLMYYFAENAGSTDLYVGVADKAPVLISGSQSVSSTSGYSTETTASDRLLKETSPPATETTPVVNRPVSQPGYTFSMTNWDDGWVSTIDTDKVVVTRGAVRVHVYFALPHDDASRNAGRDYYWDNYLTKEFRILTKQYRDHGEMLSSFRAPYIEGTAIDPKNGKNCFLALYVTSANGNMFPVLAIAPDENTIRQTFPKAEIQYQSDLAAMDRYNRFAVALSDIVGKWSGGNFAGMNYYNIYTGAYAGMNAVAMSDKFEFFSNGDYVSKHQGASGMVGSMATYSLEYKGRATVTNWEITLPNRKDGKTSSYHAWFEVVRGGRVLHLQDVQYSGMKYDLVEETGK